MDGRVVDGDSDCSKLLQPLPQLLLNTKLRILKPPHIQEEEEKRGKSKRMDVRKYLLIRSKDNF